MVDKQKMVFLQRILDSIQSIERYSSLISHHYRAVRRGFVRSIIQHKIPELKSTIQDLITKG